MLLAKSPLPLLCQMVTSKYPLSEVGTISCVSPKAVTTDCLRGTPPIDSEGETAVLQYNII